MTIELYYEYLMLDAFKCAEGEYGFLHLSYSKKHPQKFAMYFQCAMIILSKRNNEYAEIFKKYANEMEKHTSKDNAIRILKELSKSGIPTLVDYTPIQKNK